MRGLIIKQKENAEDRNLVAMLGLNLILLAFFIVLTALADSSDEKASAVMESVNQTFDSRLQRPTARYEQTLTEPVPSDQVFDNIGDLFTETLPGVEVVENSAHTALRIVVPLALVFPSSQSSAESVVIAQSQEKLASRLWGALSRYEEKGGTSEVTLLYGLGAHQTLKANQAFKEQGNLVTRRLDGLVRVFEQAGLPAHQIAVGVEQGYADKFLIVIRLFAEQNRLFEES